MAAFYFLTYQLALVVFVTMSVRLLRTTDHRHEYGLLLLYVYLVGMVFCAHVVFYPLILHSPTNIGAKRYLQWLADNQTVVLGSISGLGSMV